LNEKTKVALVGCNSYDEVAVAAAVKRGLELIGGMDAFIHPGEKIVLKPNILVGDAPDKVVSPHPAVFKAAAELAKTVTTNLTYGDSPGFGKPVGQMMKAQYCQVAKDLNIPLADFENGQEVHFPDSPFIKQFVLANGVLEADGLISLSKFKTHQLTRITGPIKNQFGCIPGTLKAEFHIKLPNALDFARMLVCLTLYVRPRVYIVDGITAMEGNGPRGGNPVNMNVLMFSKDPVALEVVMCRMIVLNPDFVPTIKPGQDWGLGTAQMQDIELVGDPLEPFINNNFKVVRAPVKPVTDTTFVPFLRNMIAARPVIDPTMCNQCGTCVHHCPAKPKAVDWHSGDRSQTPTYKYSRCIRCFCCQELCPQLAISVKIPLLGKLLEAL
jgi:uncharacterized protein (DUF362 family)/ferredoxin